MRNGILSYTASHPDWFPPGSSAKALDAILLVRQAFRRPGRQRLTWLVFQNGAPHPLVVARHYAESRWDYLLAQEFETSVDLYTRLPQPLLPEPLALAEIAGRKVFFERWVDGSSLSAELAHQSFQDSAGRSIPDLAGDHLSMALGVSRALDHLSGPCTRDELERELIGHYQAWRVRAGAVSADDVLLLDIAMSRLLALTWRLPLKKRLVNLDLVPSNILRSTSGVRVIDWEFHQVSTLWFHEPLKFAYGYLSCLNQSGWLGPNQDLPAAFRRYYAGENWAVSTAINTFLSRSGLPAEDPADLQLLWIAFLIREADLVGSNAAFWSNVVSTMSQQMRDVLQVDGVRHVLAGASPEAAGKDRAIQALQTEVIKRDQAMAVLSGHVKQQDQIVATLQSRLLEQDRAIQAMQAESAAHEQMAGLVAAQLERKDLELDAVTGSKSWKALERLRVLRVRIAPPGSRRDRVFRRLLRTGPASLVPPASRGSGLGPQPGQARIESCKSRRAE